MFLQRLKILLILLSRIISLWFKFLIKNARSKAQFRWVTLSCDSSLLKSDLRAGEQTWSHKCYVPCKHGWKSSMYMSNPLKKYEPYMPWPGLTVYIYTKTGNSYMGRQVKKCLQTCAICAESDHPAHAQSIIRAFAIHSYILLNSIILLTDSEGRK